MVVVVVDDVVIRHNNDVVLNLLRHALGPRARDRQPYSFSYLRKSNQAEKSQKPNCSHAFVTSLRHFRTEVHRNWRAWEFACRSRSKEKDRSVVPSLSFLSTERVKLGLHNHNSYSGKSLPHAPQPLDRRVFRQSDRVTDTRRSTFFGGEELHGNSHRAEFIRLDQRRPLTFSFHGSVAQRGGGLISAQPDSMHCLLFLRT